MPPSEAIWRKLAVVGHSYCCPHRLAIHTILTCFEINFNASGGGQMASITKDAASDRYRIRFRFHGRHSNVRWGLRQKGEALAMLSRVEDTLRLIGRRCDAPFAALPKGNGPSRSSEAAEYFGKSRKKSSYSRIVDGSMSP